MRIQTEQIQPGLRADTAKTPRYDQATVRQWGDICYPALRLDIAGGAQGRRPRFKRGQGRARLPADLGELAAEMYATCGIDIDHLDETTQRRGRPGRIDRTCAGC